MTSEFDIVALATLVIAIAAVCASVYSVMQMVRQRKNEIRPVLVLIEKHLDSDDDASPWGLYLVNMGQGLATEVDLVRCLLPGGFCCAGVQSAIAPQRRARLVSGYEQRILDKVSLRVNYKNIDNDWFHTTFDGASYESGVSAESGQLAKAESGVESGEHVFGWGKASA